MTSLTLMRRIAARPSILFDVLRTPEGVAFWWGPDAGPVLLAEIELGRRPPPGALAHARRHGTGERPHGGEGNVSGVRCHDRSHPETVRSPTTDFKLRATNLNFPAGRSRAGRARGSLRRSPLAIMAASFLPSC